MKARVYREGDSWVAEMDYGSWADSTPFQRWTTALLHAQWLARNAARRP